MSLYVSGMLAVMLFFPENMHILQHLLLGPLMQAGVDFMYLACTHHLLNCVAAFYVILAWLRVQAVSAGVAVAPQLPLPLSLRAFDEETRMLVWKVG